MSFCLFTFVFNMLVSLFLKQVFLVMIISPVHTGFSEVQLETSEVDFLNTKFCLSSAAAEQKNTKRELYTVVFKDTV